MSLSEDKNYELCSGDNAIGAVEEASGYKGSMISISESSDSQGYGRCLTAGEVFAGHALEAFDNSDGDNGDVDIRLRGSAKYRLQVEISGAVVTDIGSVVYASDDETYTLTEGSNTKVGKITRFVESGVCEVEFEPFVS